MIKVKSECALALQVRVTQKQHPHSSNTQETGAFAIIGLSLVDWTWGLTKCVEMMSSICADENFCTICIQTANKQPG